MCDVWCDWTDFFPSKSPAKLGFYAKKWSIHPGIFLLQMGHWNVNIEANWGKPPWLGWFGMAHDLSRKPCWSTKGRFTMVKMEGCRKLDWGFFSHNPKSGSQKPHFADQTWSNDQTTQQLIAKYAQWLSELPHWCVDQIPGLISMESPRRIWWNSEPWKILT